MHQSRRLSILFIPKLSLKLVLSVWNVILQLEFYDVFHFHGEKFICYIFHEILVICFVVCFKMSKVKDYY